MSPLTYILGFPFLAALVILLIPKNYRFLIRSVALVGSFLSLVVAVSVFANFGSAPAIDGFKFQQMVPWIERAGISYHVGVDGINIGIILMAAVVAFAATAMAREIKSNEKEFYLLLMVMEGGILGAFVSLDLFLFYFFHELALVPTFIMIGIWGRGPDKNYATFNITIYLSLGALISLIGLIALYVQSGANSFDLIVLTRHIQQNPLTLASQQVIFPLLLFGFGILVSLWPFHTWAPLGYGAAPTSTAMLHAGVLKKFGLYGLIRVAMPLLPEGASTWLNVIAILALGNIVFCGWVAMRQRDLNLLIGNSSVAHMGFIFLGIASLTTVGVTGAVVVMIAHGFLAALAFGLNGYLYNQTKTLNIDELGGLLKKMPFIGTAMIMAMMAGCGLPGFANFAGEALVLFGSWKAFPVVTGIAIWGALVIGAVYMLRAVRNVLHGPDDPHWNEVKDAGLWPKIPFVLLIVALLTFGFVPRLLTEKIEPAVVELLKMANKNKPANPTVAVHGQISSENFQ